MTSVIVKLSAYFAPGINGANRLSRNNVPVSGERSQGLCPTLYAGE